MDNLSDLETFTHEETMICIFKLFLLGLIFIIFLLHTLKKKKSYLCYVSEGALKNVNNCHLIFFFKEIKHLVSIWKFISVVLF